MHAGSRMPVHAHSSSRHTVLRVWSGGGGAVESAAADAVADPAETAGVGVALVLRRRPQTSKRAQRTEREETQTAHLVHVRL